ncbi:MAG: ABC-F family ATP-binding cassette domain-containing protein [Bacteriovoracaceae bacterium]|jgi:ATP-binding cassette subfamily F protein uup|nr:ABC-F family ATP-binding cassette domain-containing protein [Bacteriovoracaceae bacterium]
MSNLISLQNINMSFGDKIIFKNATISLDRYEKVGLIGLNGKGKSTLLKIINEDIIPDSSSPAFLYDMKKGLSKIYIPQSLPLSDDFPQARRYFLEFYPQLKTLFFELNDIEKQIQTNQNDDLISKQGSILTQIENLGGWQVESKYFSYLKKFDVPLDKPMKKLSGGQLRKIAISIGLSAQHDLILWDEPTNHLDIETIELFEDEIKNKANTFIMISHDRYILSSICDRIIHIDSGSIDKFNGNYLDYIDHMQEVEKIRSEKLTKLKNSHRRELAWMRQGIKARGTRSKKRVEGFHNIEKNIKSLHDKRKKELELNLSSTKRKTKVLMELKEASFSFKDTPIFNNSNLTLFREDRIALIGKNGAGKSTLLNIIMNELNLTSGQLKKADNLKISYFSQNRKALDNNKTPFEIIGDGSDLIHMPSGGTLHINSYLEKFLFSSSEIRRPISTLSGGEKNRLQLALFMKNAADIWIFDEPTNDLDIETIETLEQALIDYKQAVIIVSHDRAFLDKVTTKSWILQNNKVEEYLGNYSDNADLIQATLIKELPSKKLSTATQTPQQKVKLTNKEKQRLKTIDSEIEQAESLLNELETKAQNFDFTNMNEDKTNEYKKLENKIKMAKENLDELYQIWEELGEKAQL